MAIPSASGDRTGTSGDASRARKRGQKMRSKQSLTRPILGIWSRHAWKSCLSCTWKIWAWPTKGRRPSWTRKPSSASRRPAERWSSGSATPTSTSSSTAWKRETGWPSAPSWSSCRRRKSASPEMLCTCITPIPTTSRTSWRCSWTKTTWSCTSTRTPRMRQTTSSATGWTWRPCRRPTRTRTGETLQSTPTR